VPTPSKSRPQARGIGAGEHERLALRLRRLQADATAVRDAVRAGLGEAEAHQAAEEAVWALRRTRLCLAEALDGADVDPQGRTELRALYLQEGEETPARGHGSSLAGSTLHPPNGRRPLGGEG
jgi:hypothetical protein